MTPQEKQIQELEERNKDLLKNQEEVLKLSRKSLHLSSRINYEFKLYLIESLILMFLFLGMGILLGITSK